MSATTANAIVMELMGNAAITTLVGSRVAQSQVPQNTAMPALVYTMISDSPAPNLKGTGSQLMEVRVQFNPLGTSMGQVDAIHEAIRGVLDFNLGATVAGKSVISIRREPSTPRMDRDDERDVWTSPADYTFMYYE